MNAPKACLAALAFVGVVGASPGAAATPDFPGVVETDLMLPSGFLSSKVAPPEGCLLCHVNESGGPPMTQFGTLMVENGATAYEAAQTAGPALMAIETLDPRAIEDIKNGINPNSDPDAFVTGDPVPGYGCGSMAPGRPAGGSPLVLAALGIALGRFRRRWRSSCPTP